MAAPDRLPWENLSADPRDPAAASLRASDRDRETVLGLLAESYADGRLDREEYDERADLVTRAKTLGELSPVMEDLVPNTATHGNSLTRASAEELHARAVRTYEASRREALSGLLIMTVTLTAIWYVVSGDGFYWPVFVIVAGVANLLRVLLHRKDMVEREERRLERKQRKELEPPPG